MPIISFPIYHLSWAKEIFLLLPISHLLRLATTITTSRRRRRAVSPSSSKSAIIYVIHCLSFHIAWKLICINFEYAKVRRNGRRVKEVAHGIEDIMKSRVKSFFFTRSPLIYRKWTTATITIHLFHFISLHRKPKSLLFVFCSRYGSAASFFLFKHHRHHHFVCCMCEKRENMERSK